MAQGENAKKRGHTGKDYWSKRPFSGWPISHNGNKLFKRMTHKVERARGKVELMKEVENVD